VAMVFIYLQSMVGLLPEHERFLSSDIGQRFLRRL